MFSMFAGIALDDNASNMMRKLRNNSQFLFILELIYELITLGSQNMRAS